MHETLKSSKDGIGLAAPQIGILKKMIVHVLKQYLIIMELKMH